jgi:hypothetical protein
MRWTMEEDLSAYIYLSVWLCVHVFMWLQKRMTRLRARWSLHSCVWVGVL